MPYEIITSLFPHALFHWRIVNALRFITNLCAALVSNRSASRYTCNAQEDHILMPHYCATQSSHIFLHIAMAHNHEGHVPYICAISVHCHKLPLLLQAMQSFVPLPHMTSQLLKVHFLCMAKHACTSWKQMPAYKCSPCMKAECHIKWHFPHTDHRPTITPAESMQQQLLRNQHSSLISIFVSVFQLPLLTSTADHFE